MQQRQKVWVQQTDWYGRNKETVENREKQGALAMTVVDVHGVCFCGFPGL